MHDPLAPPRRSFESVSDGVCDGGWDGGSGTGRNSNLRPWEDGAIEVDITETEMSDMVGGGVHVAE